MGEKDWLEKSSFPNLWGMKTFLAAASIASLAIVGPAVSAELPVLPEKPWIGFWIGYEQRDFDFGVGGKGEGELFLKERGREGVERISLFRSLKVHYIVEEEIGGKWQRRTLEENLFETEQAASAEVEKFEFVAAYKGETKIRVGHFFDGKEIQISTELVSTESKNPIRVGVEVVFPDLYRLNEEISERELKKKMKGDEVRAVRLDGKKFKYDIYEEVSLEDEAVLGKGAIEFSLESQNLAKKTINLSLGAPKTGKFLFSQKKPLHSGFAAIWYPEKVADSKVLPVLVIEVD